MKNFFVKNVRFLIALLIFLALSAAAYFLNINEDGKPTWVWGTIVMFTAIPIETAIFCYLKQSIIQYLVGALVLAALFILCNFLQIGILTWSLLLAPACLLWPIAYGIWLIMFKLTKSKVFSVLIGWIVVSGIAIVTEWFVTRKLSWSLPFTVFLAFWPAASFAFVPVIYNNTQSKYNLITGKIQQDNAEENKEKK